MHQRGAFPVRQFIVTVSLRLEMKTIIAILGTMGAMVAVAAAANCDKLGILVYEEIGCRPAFDKGNPCPVGFDCLGLKKSNNNCYFKGKAYKIDEQVDSQLTAASCDLGCFCEKHDDTSKFKCARLDCPEWLGQVTKPGCYRKYSLESCCSVREICPPYDNSTKCVYNGREYKEGENFLPDDSCWRCVCQAGFRGEIEEPYCRRRACGDQLKFQEKIQGRCAPLYFRGLYREDDPLCCPNKWICSEENEKIKGRPKSDKRCYYGQKALRVGQGFTKTVRHIRNMTVSCECKIPPLLTCTTVLTR